MSEAIIIIEVTNEFGQKLFDKMIKKRITKSIKRANRINKKKGINYFGDFSEFFNEKDFSEFRIMLDGDQEEINKDIDKIKKFLYERIGYTKRTNIKVWEKIRKFSKDQVFKAYSLLGINITVEQYE